MQRPQLQELVEGWFKGVAYLRDHRHEAIGVLAQRIQFKGNDPLEEISTRLEGLCFPDLDENQDLFREGPNGIETSLHKAATLWHQAMPTFAPPNVSSLLDRCVLTR